VISSTIETFLQRAQAPVLSG